MADSVDFLKQEFHSTSLPGLDDKDGIGKYFSKQLTTSVSRGCLFCSFGICA